MIIFTHLGSRAAADGQRRKAVGIHSYYHVDLFGQERGLLTRKAPIYIRHAFRQTQYVIDDRVADIAIQIF